MLETKLLAGRTGYDLVVRPLISRAQITPACSRTRQSKLPNLSNVWDEIARRLAGYDPATVRGHYMWGTTGIGYNVKKAREVLGTDAKFDTLDVVFKPDVIAKFKDCGVHVLDAADDVFAAALTYLKLNPNTKEQADLEKAADLLTKVRPSVRKFHSSEYLNALASGEICLVLGYSGDIKQAQKRAAEAKNGVEIGYAIPKEGAQLWFDNLAIPKDAKNAAEAHALINFLLKPEIAAKNSNFVSYANGNAASRPLIDKAIIEDKTIYPDDATMKGFYTIAAHDQKTQRAMNRLWTRIKTGR